MTQTLLGYDEMGSYFHDLAYVVSKMTDAAPLAGALELQHEYLRGITDALRSGLLAVSETGFPSVPSLLADLGLAAESGRGSAYSDAAVVFTRPTKVGDRWKQYHLKEEEGGWLAYSVTSSSRPPGIRAAVSRALRRANSGDDADTEIRLKYIGTFNGTCDEPILLAKVKKSGGEAKDETHAFSTRRRIAVEEAVNANSYFCELLEKLTGGETYFAGNVPHPFSLALGLRDGKVLRYLSVGSGEDVSPELYAPSREERNALADAAGLPAPDELYADSVGRLFPPPATWGYSGGLESARKAFLHYLHESPAGFALDAFRERYDAVHRLATGNSPDTRGAGKAFAFAGAPQLEQDDAGVRRKFPLAHDGQWRENARKALLSREPRTGLPGRAGFISRGDAQDDDLEVDL